MQPRTALGVALFFAALAVAVVAADLSYTLTARLESRDSEGRWGVQRTAPEPEARYEAPKLLRDCAGPTLRLVVDNDRPFPATVPVELAWENSTTDQEILEDEWSLAAFEERAHEFTLPGDAFRKPPSLRDVPSIPPLVWVRALVADLHLTVCVEEDP